MEQSDVYACTLVVEGKPLSLASDWFVNGELTYTKAPKRLVLKAVLTPDEVRSLIQEEQAAGGAVY